MVETGENVVGYIRVSTEDQGDSGAGLEAQRLAIRAECDRRGWTLTGIEEDVISGRTLRRSGLEAALGSCASGDVSGVVVAKLDRLTRSVVDLGRLLERAKREGWNIVALDFGLDLSTPQGELVANVLVSVGQWERRIIGARTAEALAVKKAQGVRLGRPPLPTDALTRRVARMREGDMTFQAIADTLNRESVPTLRGGKEWRPSSVQSVLARVAVARSPVSRKAPSARP